MAEAANLHARKAAVGREMIRASIQAENRRAAGKMGIIDATPYNPYNSKASVLGLYTEVVDAGALNTAELAFPTLGKATGRLRSAYRGKLDTWAQKQDNLANQAAEDVAVRYDATEGYPYQVSDINKAQKEAEKIKKLIEWDEKLVAKYKEKIARIDARDQPDRYAGERKRLQDHLDQVTDSLDWLKHR